ncbi:MAG: Arc family DNA-binding protein [Rubrivivax sp.]|nr:Arc family DNA-binding protein [Rubrivivax sp.]
MAVNLSIKDVPEAVAERLRRRAARNHRSLQGELMAIVEQAAAETSVEGAHMAPNMAPHAGAVPVRRTQGWKSVQQVAEEARLRFPQGTPSSVDDIRAMRDSRHGDDAAR